MSAPSKNRKVYKRICPTPSKSTLDLKLKKKDYEYPPITHFLPTDLWEEINMLRSETPRPILKRDSPVMFADQQQAMIFQEPSTTQNNVYPENMRGIQQCNTFNSNSQSSSPNCNTFNGNSESPSPILIYSPYSSKAMQCIIAEPMYIDNIFSGFYVPHIPGNVLNQINPSDRPRIEIQLFNEDCNDKFPAAFVPENLMNQTNRTNYANTSMPVNTQNHPPQNIVNPTQMAPRSGFVGNFNQTDTINRRQGHNNECPVEQTNKEQNIGLLESNQFTSTYLLNGNYDDAFQDIPTTESPTIDEITPTVSFNNHTHLPPQTSVQFNGHNLPNRLRAPHVNENEALNRINGTEPSSVPFQFSGQHNNGQMTYKLPYSSLHGVPQPTTPNKNFNRTLTNTHTLVNPELNQMTNAFNDISIHSNPFYHVSGSQRNNVLPPPGFTPTSSSINNNVFPSPRCGQTNTQFTTTKVGPRPEFDRLPSGINQTHCRNVPPHHVFGNQNSEIPTKRMPAYPGLNQNVMGHPVDQSHVLLNSVPTTYVLVNAEVTEAYGFCHIFPNTRPPTLHQTQLNDVKGRFENFSSATERTTMNHMIPDMRNFPPNTPIVPSNNRGMELPQNSMITNNPNAQMCGIPNKPQMPKNMRLQTQLQASPETAPSSELPKREKKHSRRRYFNRGPRFNNF